MPEYYRHWKGGIYKKVGEHKDADSNDYPIRIDYIDTRTNERYSCSKSRWIELIIHEGIFIPRFRLMESEEVAKCLRR